MSGKGKGGGRMQAIAWGLMNTTIASSFPKVKHISTEEVADAMVAKPGGVILLDARAKAEWDVSRIEGAEFVGEDGELLDIPSLTSRATGAILVVCYCSVGYRSSRLAVKLNAAGVANAFNMKGSIFKWCNEGRAVIAGNGGALATPKAHPYNSIFGGMLDSDKHSYGDPEGSEAGTAALATN
mmetsp:Transcript_44689/g.106269  ORF Transcript_44689/g.106269 Transcript_44689/m.106269 type:complete len:183 (-) Transcript_44689:34-582(-)